MRQSVALLVGVLAVTGVARGDAIVRTQAMEASTIAEIFVVAGSVGVKLEIGPGDLAAFQGLLPEELFARLGMEGPPFAERVAGFFGETMPLRVGDGPPLAGRIVSIEGRKRLRRDEISGEARPERDGEPAEAVLFVVLEYALPGTPKELVINGVRGATVGFVVYHEGIAVNDFRYLAPRQILHLDWEDPWYTRFESRSLRRQYYAPMSGFLYVEPYEVRKEIVARAIDLQHWVDLGLAGQTTIPAEVQPELLRRAGEFLRGHQVVEIDGVRVEPELARIHFLERTLRTSRVIDPPEPLDVHAATLGAIFVYPTDGLPQRVTLDWDLWHERIESIPAASVDQAGPLPTYLERDFRTLLWQNFLKNPVLPTLLEVGRPATGWERALRWASVPLAGAGLALAVLALLRRRRSWVAPALALLVAGGVAFGLGGRARVSDHGSAELVGRLLHNVYRAFDFREDERIYDTLARSVAGDLLEQVFLETRRGLELQSQGGARAKVKEVVLESIESEAAAGGAFAARATWAVRGSVGHWGHVHERRNRYRADLTVTPVDGAWRLTRVEILEEERL